MNQDTHPRKRRQHHKGPLNVFAILIAIALLVAGGIMIHHHNDQQQMKEIVHSKEATQVYKKMIKEMDPKAFSQQGIIHYFR